MVIYVLLVFQSLGMFVEMGRGVIISYVLSQFVPGFMKKTFTNLDFKSPKIEL